MILHVVRCDGCGVDTPMDVRTDVMTGVVTAGSGYQIPQTERSFAVPSKIKQIDGHHFCGWPCVATYAQSQPSR